MTSSDFTVRIKELQSLCLDVRVLDEAGSEIELKDDDDDDYIPSEEVREEIYAVSDDDFESSGYTLDEDHVEEAGADLGFGDFDDDDDDDDDTEEDE